MFGVLLNFFINALTKPAICVSLYYQMTDFFLKQWDLSFCMNSLTFNMKPYFLWVKAENIFENVIY